MASIAILGGGPTGLGAAYRLRERGVDDFEVYERSGQVGGLATSFQDSKGYTWDVSGHIIFSDFLYTGDGIVTALNVLRVMAETGRTLADLAGDLQTYPQVLLNLRVREKRDWMTIPAAARAIEGVEAKLAGRGRLLVRYSGTEPLLRVMIEGERQDEINAWAEEIVAAVGSAIGE